MLTLPRQRIRSTGLLLALRLILGLGCFSPQLAAADTERKPFAIPAAAAEVTLETFSDQADVQVVYLIDDVRGVATNPVQGVFAIREALERLVAGTGLRVVLDEKTRAFAITRDHSARPTAEDKSRNQTAPPPQTMKKSLPARLTAALAAFTTSILSAQTAPASPDSSPTTEDPITLSPFHVTASSDKGYQASLTLAGTRLNTPLSDIGAPVTVITKEFLQDTGVTDINQLFLYTASTEGSGLGGNFSATDLSGEFPEQSNSRARPQFGTRVRGLVAADLTRDYFLTAIPLEEYNVERIDISRGPNAILFGLGSPAGVANNTLLKPSYARDTYKVTLRYGDHDSYRSVIDANQILIPKQLAARVALLNKETQWQQNPTFERDNRIFATVKANPFKDTTLTATYENGKIKAREPATISPRDRMVMWFQEGKPTWDPTIPVNLQTNPIYPPNGPTGIYDTPGAVFAFPAFFDQWGVPLETNSSAPTMAGFMGFRQPTLTDPVTGVAPTSLRFMGVQQTTSFGNDLRNQGLPIGVFDFRNQLIGGETGFSTRNFNATNVVLEQHFLNRRVGVELGYNKEHYTEFFREPFAIERVNGIDIDVNTKLMDGRANPNFGRPYMSAWESGDKRSNIARESWRATAYGMFDAAEQFKGGFGRWLGRHTLTAFASSQKVGTSNNQTRLGWVGGDAPFDLNNPSLVTQARAVANLIYVGPSVAGLTAENQMHLNFNLKTRLTQPGDTRDIVFWDRQTQTWQTGQFRVAEGVISALKQQQKIDSQAAILQSYWLKDTLITTVGWRKDKSTSYASTVYPQFTSGDLQGSIDLSQVRLNPIPADQITGEIKTYSVVAKLPRNLELPLGLDPSIHYSQSENFQPSAGLVSIFGTKLPPPNGQTKEYGFSIAALKNRANLKFNWYQTDLSNAATGSGVSSGFVAALLRVDLQTAGWWYDGVNAKITGPTMPTQANIDRLISTMPKSVLDMVGYQIVKDSSGNPIPSYTLPTNVTDVTNLSARGFEIEGTFNLTDNWRVALNAAKEQTKKANTASFVAAYIAQRKPIWDEFAALQRVPATPDPLPNSMGRTVIAQALLPLAQLQANDGAYSPELRKWRLNFVNNYTFRSDSLLKGVGVGGAWRWQDKAAIDYPRITGSDGVPRPDVTRPFFAPSESQIDVWASYSRPIMNRKLKWKLQVNVSNLFADRDGLIPVTVHGYGTPAYVRVAPPRTWFLTSTFEY